MEDNHLSDYVLTEEATVAKLTLSADDHTVFEHLLAGAPTQDIGDDKLSACYKQLKAHIDELAGEESDYRRLIELVEYVDKQVQVLLAVASSLPEAYVIFETLNDRGADLTTADLLKNYLFNQAGKQGISHAEAVWTRISGRFEKADELVKFLRYEYMSRNGHVTNRGLYKALQSDIGQGSKAVREYLDRLEAALQRYVALREPDDASWSSQAIEVKDSLLAFRRFGFEASTPLLLAAFSSWSHSNATRFVDIVANWSVRAWIAGLLGGGVAEKAFCDAAVSVSESKSMNPNDVRPFMRAIVPDDAAFKQAFLGYGTITTTRAKYLLARLERQYLSDAAEQTDAMPDWSSKSVSVEHIFAKSTKRVAFNSDEDFEQFNIIRDQLQNLTLLERTLNANLEDRSFEDKAATYKKSAFALTRSVGDLSAWTFAEASVRAETLASLAVKAWPR